ncbi:MAG: M42 family metallopeptidase [Methanosphaera sp.]|nr:M42 family metallopeptidase [Methanosphaera sp.]
MKELLKKLSEACGISGFETEIREIIKDELKDNVDDMETDVMGNLITTHKGKEGKPSVMLASHMDEIGLMVSYIDDDGYLRFVKIGGINDQMLLNQKVYVQSKNGEVPGIIGSKPPHITSAEEAKKIIPYTDMFIDIGAKNKEQAEELVTVGDPIVFHTEFEECLNDLVMGKALDNRVGCTVMTEVMKRLDENCEATVYGVATVQEEVGLKGAKTSSFKLNPDMAIALDVTIAGDHPGVKPENAPVVAGEGPAIILADASGRGLITNPMMKEKVLQAAEDAGINYQLEVSDGGTTDGAYIHLTREGIATITISSGARYIHTPISVVNIKDVEDTVNLIVEFLNSL